MKFLWAVVALIAWNASAADSYTNVGPFSVETLNVEWRDAKRERDIPAKIYYPHEASNPCPVIVFSHGLGGSREGYAFLGRHWASHGYISVHVQHHGSDDEVWRGNTRPMQSMRGAAMDPANIVNRPIDISFAIDELKALNAKDPLRGKLDLERVGVAGHSFGAFTSLAIAGQRLGPKSKSWADERVSAVVALSAPVPKREEGRDYSKITIPIFHMTGTADSSPIGDTAASERRIPFDSISNATEYLVTFEGGDHMVFSGPTIRKRSTDRDLAAYELIKGGTTAFWDAYLKKDDKAKKWIEQGGFKNALGAAGVFEQKKGGK
jgi:predicted dienelactone hydrolase